MSVSLLCQAEHNTSGNAGMMLASSSTASGLMLGCALDSAFAAGVRAKAAVLSLPQLRLLRSVPSPAAVRKRSACDAGKTPAQL